MNRIRRKSDEIRFILFRILIFVPDHCLASSKLHPILRIMPSFFFFSTGCGCEDEDEADDDDEEEAAVDMAEPDEADEDTDEEDADDEGGDDMLCNSIPPFEINE